MKKIICSLLVLFFMGTYVNAASLATAVAKYKAGNYAGCINDLNAVANSMGNNKDDVDTIKKLITIFSKYDLDKWLNGNVAQTEENEREALKIIKELQKVAPRASLDRFAYLFYYYALSLHQLGYKDQAKQFYKSAAFFCWESKSDIFKYSLQAVKCIDSPDSCKSSDMDEFIQSGKPVSDEIVKTKLKENLNKHRNNINQGKDLSWLPQKQSEQVWADEGISDDISEITKSEEKTASMPSDEEIGRAVRTLQRAGINPTPYIYPSANNEYAQLNALLNDNNYNNDYSTLMMNNTNGQISPELMQIIMRQQMMGGYGSF